MSGLQPETPYSSIVSALQGIDDEAGAIGGDREPLTVDCLRIDRSAIVKFKKAGDVSLSITLCSVVPCYDLSYRISHYALLFVAFKI